MRGNTDTYTDTCIYHKISLEVTCWHVTLEIGKILPPEKIA